MRIRNVVFPAPRAHARVCIYCQIIRPSFHAEMWTVVRATRIESVAVVGWSVLLFREYLRLLTFSGEQRDKTVVGREKGCWHRGNDLNESLSISATNKIHGRVISCEYGKNMMEENYKIIRLLDKWRSIKYDLSSDRFKWNQWYTDIKSYYDYLKHVNIWIHDSI